MRGLLAAALWLIIPPTLAAQWFLQNPYPSARSLSGLAAVGDTAIAVGGSNKLLRTNDGGSTWIKQELGWDIIHPELTNFGQPDLYDVSLVDPETATVAGFSYYNCIGDLCPPPPSNHTYYAFIARTEDGGSTWTPQVSGVDMVGVALSSVDFLDADTGVAVGLDEDTVSPVILRTADGGNSWSRATLTDGPSVGYLLSVAFADANVGAAVGMGLDIDGSLVGLILQTTDGGVTWQQRQVEPGVGLLNHVTFMSPTAGIAVGNDGVLLTTADGGASWIRRESETDRFLGGVSCTDALTCLVVGGGPGDATGGTAGRIVLRTADGGETWAVELLEDGVAALWRVAYHDADTLSAVGDGKVDLASEILRSVDGGLTWSTRSQSATAELIRAVSFSDVNTGTAVGDGGMILGTHDGGNSWVRRISGSTALLLDVSFADASSGMTVGQEANAAVSLRTTDGGHTWIAADPVPAEVLLGVSCTSDTHCTTVGFLTTGPDFEGAVLRTDDGGSTWTTQLSQQGLELRSVSCADEQHCGVAGHERPGGVGSWRPVSFVTEDGGATWTRTEIDEVGWAGAIYFSDTDTATVVGADSDIAGGAAIWRTTDGGSTWVRQEVPSLVTTALLDVAFANEQVGTAVGPGGTILTTTDGGEIWVQELGEAIAGQWTSVDLAGVDTATAVGSDGKILRTVGGPTFPLHLQPMNAAACVPESGTLDLSIEVGVGSVGGYAGTVELSVSGEPAGVSSAFDPALLDAPGASAWTLTLDTGVPIGRHVLTLTADDGARQQIANLLLDVIDPSQGPSPVMPADGAIDVDLRPTFTWSAIAGVDTYRIQVATDIDFVDVVIDQEVPGVSFVPTQPLSSDAEYFWRIMGVHECGGVWSAVFGFRTRVQPLAQITPDTLELELPPEASDSVVLTISNVGTGDLVWTVATGQPSPASGGDGSGCQDPGGVTWLSVAPDAGTTPAGGSSEVQATVDTVDLPPGGYNAEICVQSNDAETPVVTIPVALTVQGPDLAFDPPSLDFGDIEGGTTSPLELVTLQSTGALDAVGLVFEILGDDGFDADTSGCSTTLPVGGQCKVSVTFTPPALGPAAATLRVYSDNGATAIVQLTGNGVPETQAFTPVGLAVDAEIIISDANGVFEPGELVPVAPRWRNDGLLGQFLEGTASSFGGPDGPIYSLIGAEADYGEVDSGATADCQTVDLCYQMDIGPRGVERPALHWDAAFDETLSEATEHTWILHLGDSFADMPRSSPFYPSIETLLHYGVTDGCTAGEYCPAGINTRGQMAVFLLKAVEGSDHAPPACAEDGGRFADVPADSPLCPWIEELAGREITSGCGGGNYCPGDAVSRAQMAVFLLRAFEGGDYAPPACAGEFDDVLCASPFAAWIEELAARQVTSGCSETAYCPSASVTRAQMAAFVSKTFGLALYGP